MRSLILPVAVLVAVSALGACSTPTQYPDPTRSVALDGQSNFREIAYEGADRVPEGTREISTPIDTEGELTATLIEARKTGDFSQVPVEISVEIHEALPQQGRAQYAALLRELAEPDAGTVVFHCSHGVHRTGTAAAIVLWTLGVPWETIRDDYLQSNVTRATEVQQRLEALRLKAAGTRGIDPAGVDMTNVRAFYLLEGAYIDATRDRILADYGSIDGYLRDGLGLDEATIEALRSRLLE